MERHFVEIVRKVNMTDEFLKAAKLVTNKVFENLRGCRNLNIARVVISGSVGNNTAVNENLFETDVDLVAYVNKKSSDEKEDEILEVCRDELTKIPGFKLSNAINGNLLQFSLPVIVGGQATPVDFDLVIATNFGYHQVTNTMKKIGDNPSLNTIHRYGPSLSIETMGILRELMKGSTRDVVLVAKFWDKTLKKCDKEWGFIGGRSYMIELIAIHANKDAPDNSVYQGFLRFLKKMAGLETMNVTFSDSYQLSQIPIATRNERPLVMDPINFYYNVAKGIDRKDIQRYQVYAAKALRLIELNPNYLLTVDNFHHIIGF